VHLVGFIIRRNKNTNNAAVEFNNIYGIDQVTPKYIQIEVKGNNQEAKNTKLAKL